MEEKIDWELRDISSKINAQIIVTTGGLIDAWNNELITLNLPNAVINKLWLETAFFGAYLLLKRFSAPLEAEKSKFVDKAVRDAFIDMIPIYTSDKKGDNADLKKYITSGYDRTLEMYKNYKGVDTKILFCDLARNVFNLTKDSKIKFIDNTFWTRVKLKFAFFLRAFGGNKELMDKHINEVYLPNENLIAFADSATQAFVNVSESDIRD